MARENLNIVHGDESDGSRPIADGIEELKAARDDVPRVTDDVIDVLRGDMENVRHLIERAQKYAPPSALSEVDAIGTAMAGEIRGLRDEVGGILSGAIDELEQLRRPVDHAVAERASTTAVIQPVELPVTHISSTDPAHAEIRKKRRPSAVIIVDDTYSYTTDEQSRVVRTEATLTLREPGRRNKRAQRYLKGKLPGDDAGHLIARVLGGIGNELNLVPMERYQVNKSEYRAVEEHWEEAVKLGYTVYVTIEIGYEETDPRPTDFFVTYEIDGEMYWSEIGNPLPKGQS